MTIDSARGCLPAITMHHGCSCGAQSVVNAHADPCLCPCQPAGSNNQEALAVTTCFLPPMSSQTLPPPPPPCPPNCRDTTAHTVLYCGLLEGLADIISALSQVFSAKVRWQGLRDSQPSEGSSRLSWLVQLLHHPRSCLGAAALFSETGTAWQPRRRLACSAAQAQRSALPTPSSAWPPLAGWLLPGWTGSLPHDNGPRNPTGLPHP